MTEDRQMRASVSDTSGSAPSPSMTLPDWIIADTHFFHEHIVAYAGRPATHEQLIVEHWRARVSEGQTILHLGDVAFGLPDTLLERMGRLGHLPGQVLLIAGNHDSARKRAALAALGWTVVKGFDVRYRGWTVRFRHAPPQEPRLTLADRTLIVHGHLHEKRIPSPFYLNCSVEQTGYAPVPAAATIDAHLTVHQLLDDAVDDVAADSAIGGGSC